jgi:hypothetical protein
MSRRAFFGLVALAFSIRRSRSIQLEAIAAAQMPHRMTITADRSMLDHQGIFEIRDYGDRREILLHDSLEARWRSAHPNPANPPISIALYRRSAQEPNVGQASSLRGLFKSARSAG